MMMQKKSPQEQANIIEERAIVSIKYFTLVRQDCIGEKWLNVLTF